MDYTYTPRPRQRNWSFIIALLLLVIVFFLGLTLILYVVLWKPPISAPPCQTNGDCDIGQVCQTGTCTEIVCASNADCPESNLCIDSFCYQHTCLQGNDCPTGTACVNNRCVAIGNTCQSNSDCHGLSCTNNRCVQCTNTSNCDVGQGCFDNVCRYPMDGETGTAVINYPSVAQTNGNITAPPGYFCSTADCGQTATSCPSNELCPSTCPFCISSVCRCTAGALLEPCRSNGDCISGLCGETELGKVCIPIGGECISNYNGTGGVRVCPMTRPYCVNGTCSTTSLGAVCGSPGDPTDLCRNPQALGAPGQTGVAPDGMGFFCVNGLCQNEPGQLNSLCTDESCEFIESDALVCSEITDRCIAVQ